MDRAGQAARRDWLETNTVEQDTTTDTIIEPMKCYADRTA
jgi:hypothetical protein